MAAAADTLQVLEPVVIAGDDVVNLYRESRVTDATELVTA